ncbi:hypothetical protein V1477_009505 [Vespula maculifrons]|uniref:Uncharacterized protein n=1 Tax=Vespula maculifrons TaxID=7453 RepID=A0ABD2C9Z2_VESMC
MTQFLYFISLFSITYSISLYFEKRNISSICKSNKKERNNQLTQILIIYHRIDKIISLNNNIFTYVIITLTLTITNPNR